MTLMISCSMKDLRIHVRVLQSPVDSSRICVVTLRCKHRSHDTTRCLNSMMRFSGAYLWPSWRWQRRRRRRRRSSSLLLLLLASLWRLMMFVAAAPEAATRHKHKIDAYARRHHGACGHHDSIVLAQAVQQQPHVHVYLCKREPAGDEGNRPTDRHGTGAGALKVLQ